MELEELREETIRGSEAWRPWGPMGTEATSDLVEEAWFEEGSKRSKAYATRVEGF